MMRVALGFVLLALSALHALAASAPYKVLPGDTLDVTVWQDEKLNRRIIVAPDGRISFPLAGHLQAGGVTIEGIEAALKQRLAKQFNGEVDISVSLVQQQPATAAAAVIDPSFYVAGEVAKPGQYFFKTPTNVLQSIALSGGFGPFAAQKRIRVRRLIDGIEHFYDFNYDSFISGTDTSKNIVLKAGDVVIVPEKGLFE